MNLHLNGKVAVITGGSSGIGAGITKAFAAEGAIACILTRNATEARALVTDIRADGQRADSFPVELTDTAAVERCIQDIALRYGGIDIIVNNAGGNDAIGLRHSADQFRASLENNVVHYFTVAHFALGHLIASKGSIINIGSKTAVTGQGGTSGYAASKGAIHALTREWALDLTRHGIRVNCVIPAEVITPLYEQWLAQAPDPIQARAQLNRSIPMGRRTTTVDEIANAVVFLASDRSSHTTGQLLFVDGGYVHLDRACTMETSHLKVS